MASALTDHINHLRPALQQPEGLQPAQRDQLLQSLADLDQSLAAGDDSHLPLRQQLEESMLELEAKYPSATQLLQGLAEVLGRVGL